jgi:hypothetical protein
LTTQHSKGTALRKYLARHAEPEARLGERVGRFDRVLCVPAAREPAACFEQLAPALDGRTLTVIVINGTADDQAGAKRNAETLQLLRSGGTRVSDEPPAWLTTDPPRLVVDRASPGWEVPAKKAVGLARKVAADIACAMFAGGALTSRWIHMTDCDVELPGDYFSASSDRGVLLTYPFRHVATGDAAVDSAHAIYEAFLRYYVLGLRRAGSRHAVHTIGSTLAADVNAYAAVRGMPKRQAAEDFYLVNKISKQGAVVTPVCSPLRIRSRRSLRVPFGTGRSTAAIVERGGRDFYHPDIFELVGAWLRAVDRAADDGVSPAEVALDAVPSKHRDLLSAAIAVLDAERTLARALDATPDEPGARRKRAHEHFDAFRTRKLVHLLRDGGLGELPWRRALHEAPFVDVDPDAPPFRICEQLATAEYARA